MEGVDLVTTNSKIKHFSRRGDDDDDDDDSPATRGHATFHNLSPVFFFSLSFKNTIGRYTIFFIIKVQKIMGIIGL